MPERDEGRAAVTFLEITTAKICPVDCAPYCPQQAFRKAYSELPVVGPTNRTPSNSLLSFEDFCRALETVPTRVRIHFAGFAEPCVNPRFLDMLEHARRKGHALELDSTLVGLKPADIERIRAVNPERFCFHTPDDQGIAHIPDTTMYRDVVMLALRRLNITSFSRMGVGFESNERAGNCENAPRRHVRGPFRCRKLIEPEFVMLPNCDVVLCCMDWRLQHRLGNLLTTSWQELATSPEYRRIADQRRHLDGDTLCRSCLWAEPVVSLRGVSSMAHEVFDQVRRPTPSTK